jgi:CheY-like chemotaxis protein
MKPPRALVLVVEDDPDAAGLIAEMVSWWDYRVRVAYDAPTALAIAAELRPDIILLDLWLGDVDGYDLAPQLRAASGTGEIRMITISGRPPDPARAAAAGIEAHVVKPEVGPTLARLIGPDRDAGT